MKIIINRNDLAKGLNDVSKGLGTKDTLPILKAVKFETCKAGIKLSATDLEISVATEVPAEVLAEGSILLEGKLLIDIIKKLPEGKINMELKEERIRIQAGKSKFKLQTLGQVKDFPTWEDVEGKEVIVEGTVLKELILKNIVAVASDETRPVLTGLLFQIKNGEFTVVGLDGYRLSKMEVKIQGDIEVTAIIPGKSLIEIAKLIGDEEVRVSFSDKRCLFLFNKTQLVTRVLDGEFINYANIIPEEFKTSIKVNVNDLKDTLSRAMVICKTMKSQLVKLSLEGNNLSINASGEIGNVNEIVEVEKEGENLEIAFNIAFFIEGLRVIQEEEVSIGFNGPLSPAVMKESHDFLYLVLPVRLAE